MVNMKRNVDPITLEVVRNSLIAAAEEMATVLARTAYNVMIYEVQDFCVCLFDENGQLVAQDTSGLPIFLSDLGMAIEDGIQKYGRDGFAPGDVIIMNHPYICGQHLNNMVIYTPAFYEGKLIGFPAARAHWVDVGGSRVGFNTMSTEIFAEGLQFRSIKIYEAGKPNDAVMQILTDNLRFPEAALGDLRAQIASCRIGEQRLLEIVKKYGYDTFRGCIEEIWDQSEQLTRLEVEKLKDGVYTAEGFMDNDGVDMDKPVNMKISVKVEGSNVTMDFSEIADQCKGFINSGYSGGIAAARVAFKNITLPSLPINEGCFRPLKVIIPEGKVLNAKPPAALGEWSTSLPLVIDLILKALAPALPDKIPAAHKGDMGGFTIHGMNPRTGKRFVCMEIHGGGWGGRPYEDGVNTSVSICQGNVKNVPRELIETYYPLRVERFCLRQDSCGAGKYRGGLGLEYIATALADCYVNLNTDRIQCPPWGLWGGKPAEPQRSYVRQSPDDEWHEVTKVSNLFIKKGGGIRILTAGGGGWGECSERDIAAIENDLIEGYISPEYAEKYYGYKKA